MKKRNPPKRVLKQLGRENEDRGSPLGQDFKTKDFPVSEDHCDGKEVV